MNKILVIEDDQDLGELMRLALTSKYQVRILNEHAGIMETLDSFFPDLIILDHYIGQWRAPDIIREIKKARIHINIPFVLFSGHHDLQRIATELKAVAYIPKPFALAELYSCVETVFASPE